MLELLKKIMGITELEKKMAKLEIAVQKKFKTRLKTVKKEEKDLMKILVKKMTTNEIAKKLSRSRTWTSLLLNKLEKEGKVKEAGKKGRSLLYKKVSK